jgi:hypothetical protein
MNILENIKQNEKHVMEIYRRYNLNKWYVENQKPKSIYRL